MLGLAEGIELGRLLGKELGLELGLALGLSVGPEMQRCVLDENEPELPVNVFVVLAPAICQSNA